MTLPEARVNGQSQWVGVSVVTTSSMKIHAKIKSCIFEKVFANMVLKLTIYVQFYVRCQFTVKHNQKLKIPPKVPNIIILPGSH